MRAVVDTNVIAYYVLGTPEFDAEVREFWRCVEDPIAPALWEAELANVIWMSVRGDVLTKEDAPAKLRLAAQLGIHSVSVRKLWQGSNRRCASPQHPYGPTAGDPGRPENRFRHCSGEKAKLRICHPDAIPMS